MDGDGCSSTCQVEDGWICEDPISPTSGSNVINDGSFEAGAFGGTWNEYSLNFGTPLCTVGFCGTGTGTGPSDGAWWAWFGGIGAYEEGAVSQDVTIPATSTDLTFDLEQIVCDSGADYMEMTVDGNMEFWTNGGSALCGTLGYSTQTVDLSAYADGGSHTLEFHSEIFANNGGGSNFFVDNVFLSDNQPIGGSPSVCTQLVDDVGCFAGVVGFHEGIPSTWTVIDNAGTALVWSNIAGAGEGGNYTGGADDAATASSDIFGPADFDTELRSNTFSLANMYSASLNYLANYQNYAGLDYLDLDISADGGATWTNLLSWNEDHGGFRNTPGEAVSIDLSPFLGMSDLQLRWRYYDPTTWDWDWYAQIDHAELACILSVSIDIKPGSYPNSINLKSKGNVPVAVLTTDVFDATTVDPASVVFAGASPLRWAYEDVDGDGDIDLLFHFDTQELNLDGNSTEASLTGVTFDGVPIHGVDSVNIVH